MATIKIDAGEHYRSGF